MKKKTNEQKALSFTYKNQTLFLSRHAYLRIQERFSLYNRKDVANKVSVILKNGLENEFFIFDEQTKKKVKERTISYEETTLHVRDNTIVTVKYNYQFYGRVASKKTVRTLNRNFK